MIENKESQDGILTPSTTFDLKYMAILPHTPEGGTPTPYDLTSLFQEFNIYQDLGLEENVSPSLTANVLIKEGWDILDTMPILGGEEVVISFKSPAATDYTALSFRVSRVGRVADESNSSAKKAFWLHLVTTDAYKDSMLRKSVGLQGSYSDMAAKIFEMLESRTKFEDIDPTYGIQERFATPLWPVLKSIDYMARRSYDEIFMPFVFYEDFTGYHFKSLTTLFNQGNQTMTAEEKQEAALEKKFFRDPQDAPLLQNNNFNSERFMRTIIKAEKKLARDQFMANYHDVLAVDERVYDFRTKTVTPTSRVYTEWFADTAHLDPYPLFSDEFNRENVRYLEAQPDGAEQVDYAKRVIKFSLASTVMRLLLVGDNRLNVGQVYYIEDLSNRPKQNENLAELSKLSSGHYIITKIRHKISRLTNDYQCVAEIAKDSMIEKVLPPQTNQSVASQPTPVPVDKGQSQKV
ncbi:tail completion protein [Klebsiella phage PWKp5]|nr:tail completion protein [Klebsiella phage PWKp5]CAK6598344.1 tail protein [Klebsiella phage vB_Ko_K5lambda5]